MAGVIVVQTSTMNSVTKNALLLGGLGFAAYFLWKKAGGAIASITDPASTALANWYVTLTSNGTPIPQGYIVLPDGSSVAAAQLAIKSVPNSNSAVFNYNDQTYYLNSPHDVNGNWAASTTQGN